MTSQLLNIRPETLEFSVVPKKQSFSFFQLTNATKQAVPVVDAVTMHALRELPPDKVCKHKFLIKCTAVPAGTTDEDITASMFSKEKGKYIEENELIVTLVSNSDSPDDDLKENKATNNFNAPMKKAMDLPRDQGFTNEKTSANSVTYSDEPKISKERDVVQMHGQNIVGLDGVKLVKDIEEVKLKIDALERLIVKEEHNRFPLPSLCVGALIGVVIGYFLRIEISMLYVVVLLLIRIVLKSMASFVLLWLSQ